MGKMADDLLNGDVDSETGEWIGGGEGFPRTFNRGLKFKKQGHPALNGVIKFLIGRKIPDWQKPIRDYATMRNYPCVNHGIYDDMNKDIAIEIQKDFSAFVEYIKTWGKD